MRHLQYRNDFLNKKVHLDRDNFKNYYRGSSIIKESVTTITNDITWGGSLIGRLINSIIRKATIYTKWMQIDRPFQEVKKAIDTLVSYAALSDDLRKQQMNVLYNSLLSHIYKIVESDETPETKIGALIASGDGGLVGELIDNLNSLEDGEYDKRDELVAKLEKFRDLLKELDIEPGYTGDEEDEEGEEDEDEKGQGEEDESQDDEAQAQKKEARAKESIFEFYKTSTKFFKSIIDLAGHIKNRRTILEGDEKKPGVYKIGNQELKPGGPYDWISNEATGGKPVKVIVLSTRYRLQSGPDKLIPTNDDIEKDELSPGTVFVVRATCGKCKGSGQISENIKGKPTTKKDCDICNKTGVLYKQDKNDADDKLKKAQLAGIPLKYEVVRVKDLRIAKSGGPGGATPPITAPLPARSFYKNDFTFERHFYEMEMLPIYEDTSLAKTSNQNRRGKENVAIIGKDEKNATNAWKKILKVYNNKDLNLDQLAEQLKKIVEESTSGGKVEKNRINLIAKQVIENESTIGKPITYDELIKETKIDQQDLLKVAKHISLLSRIVLAMKEDLGITGSFGLAGDYLKNFIKSYEEMKKIYPKIKDIKFSFSDKVEAKEKSQDKKEDKDKDKDKDKKNDSRLTILDYRKFRLFEELEDEEEDEEDPDFSDEDTDTDTQDEDQVKSAWSQSFDKGDVDKYKVSQEDVDDLSRKTKEATSKEFRIDPSKAPHKDQIMKIVNAFGRAYRLYATDYIPSGRPGGRVSLKTFREYEYIGNSDSGRGGEWSGEDSTPGRGPWAVKMIFEAWEDKITGLLEEEEYKEILQNAKFLYPGGRKEGSGESEKDSYGNRGRGGDETRREIKAGRSLLDFINDMINPTGGFKKARRQILSEYFGGVDQIPKEAGDPDEDRESIKKPKVSKDEMGEEGEISFFAIKTPNFISKVTAGIKVEFFFTKFENCFFRIKVFDRTERTYKYLKGYVFEDQGKKIFFKYNRSKNISSDMLILEYLNANKDKLESYNKNEKPKRDASLDTFICAIDYGVILGEKRTLKLQEAKITGNNQIGDVKSREDLQIDEIQILCENKGSGGKVDKFELVRPSFLSKDITDLKAIVDKFKTT